LELDGGERSDLRPGSFTRGVRVPGTHCKETGGTQSRSGRGSEERKSYPCLCNDKITGRPARSLFTILTELHRLPSYDNGPRKIELWIILLCMLQIWV